MSRILTVAWDLELGRDLKLGSNLCLGQFP